MNANTNWLFLVMAACLTFSDAELYGRVHDWHISKLRLKHRVDPMNPDIEINVAAQECANYYAGKGETDQSCEDKTRRNLIDRKTGKPAGESTAILAGELKPEDAIKMAVQQWYGQTEMWDFTAADAKNGHQKSECSDFTQLVWKKSEKFGLGVSTKAGKTYVVALYSPPGNNEGEFRDNVLPPKE